MQLTLYLCVGFLWGCTNAYLKKGCSEKKGEKGLLKEMICMLHNWHIVIPYLLNQLGSLLYYYLLGHSDISLVMPLCNVISFFFTFLTEIIIFNKAFTFKSVIGLSFLSVGLFLCLNS
ncbi:conserved protein, unknown function [Plasmodium gonderi]|uniref:Transmembrane protein 234 n=1 Tax=Plasmodium gonderi TaxID=77519 RepID=A0A1Y1JI38_PLAGO|nr:conserved protein, unknown function [Plasmodium gonderi]GAW81900.1 conserved protein, unknown function [Plasmodium gonderi]